MKKVVIVCFLFGLLLGSSWGATGRTLSLQGLQPQSLQPAEPVELTWPASPDHEKVHVYYSSDQGRSWWMMARELPNVGSFSTFVPNLVGPSMIKIVNSKNGALVLQSQATWNVRPSATPAAVQTLIYEAESGVLEGTMKVGMNGQAFNNRIVYGYSYNRRGGVELLVDIPVAGTYAIWGRVLGRDDLANSFFTSVDNGTEYWWDLKKDNAWHWDQISDRGATGTFEGDAEVSPVLFSLTAGKHLLRVRNREKSTVLDQIRITNDLSQAITAEPDKWIHLIAPEHTQIVPFGHPFEIKWSSLNLSGPVDIDLSRDQGASFAYPIVKNTENDGSYIWNVPVGLKSARGVIRIQPANNGLPMDVNDGYFAIIDPSEDAREIIIQYPNGGETLVAGEICYTMWNTKNYWGVVNVYFSPDNGATWQNIAVNRDAAKDKVSYDWIVPNIPTTKGLLRVADSQDGYPFDVSNGVFTILPGIVTDEILELITPNGTEKWAVGSVQHVVWLSSNFSNNVNLDLSLNNGNTWQRVLSNQPPQGWVEWTVPNTPADRCRMRVIDAVDGIPVFVSTSAFSIVTAGTQTGNPPNPSNPPPSGTTDFALSFDGVNDFVQIANHPSLNISKNFTIEFWLKTDQPTQNWTRILEKGMWDEYSVSFYSTKAKLCASLVSSIPGSTPRMAVTHGPSATALSANTWYHVAMTYDGAVAKVYMNGKLESSKNLTGVTPRSLTQALIIGAARRLSTPEYPFRGVLDELRLWNVARSNAQITASMTTALAGNETGLAAYYPMDEGTGQYVIDHTSNANHGWLGTTKQADDSDASWVAGDRPKTVSAMGQTMPLAQSSESAVSLPQAFALHANYPNPFNNQTAIAFALPESRMVQLAIYDVTGRLVKNLANGAFSAGEHRLIWTGLNDQGEIVPSGVYFYRLSAGDWSAVQRLVLIK